MNELAARLLAAVNGVIVGKPEAVRLAILTLLARGHLLIEDVPGVGKTLLARALARGLDARFRRIQFTPDLLPADITGSSVFDQRNASFEFRPGPVFTNVLLADEINRATPRTQSALLECMEERQVTADGETRPIEEPFFVVATQNTIEHQGTFPLPEAQLDRFALRVRLGYPGAEQEAEILEAQQRRHPIEEMRAVGGTVELLAAQAAVRDVFIEPSLRRYIVDLARATREDRDVLLGASPRASLTLMRAAQAAALLDGSRHVAPQQVHAVAHAVLEHRLVLRPKARLAGSTARAVVERALREVAVPVS